MRKTTRDEVPKPTVFTRNKVRHNVSDENIVGSYDYRTRVRMADKEALARAKEMEAALGNDMVDVVIDDKTIVRVRRDKAEAAEKLYKKRKSCTR